MRQEQKTIPQFETNNVLLEKLYKIMSGCIGRKNSIEARELLYKIYGTQTSPYKAFFRFCELQRMLTYLRKNTKCFVVSEKIEGISNYYVVKTHDEANKYCKKLDKHILGIENMKERCYKAVRKQYWAEI